MVVAHHAKLPLGKPTKYTLHEVQTPLLQLSYTHAWSCSSDNALLQEKKNKNHIYINMCIKG